jgi:hypothetical protein
MPVTGWRMALALGLAAGAASAMATEYDLSPAGSQSFNVAGDVGGTAIVRDYFSQPAGTGVFEPFLTIDANGQTSTGLKTVEQGYNTAGFTAMYLDQLRPQWNKQLTFGSLASLTVNGQQYYGFVLDANEPGSGKSVISIDNFRVYTSATDNTASVGNDLTKLNNLGTLRWALNDPLKTGPNFDIDNWIKLDSAQENVDAGSNVSNGGSGKSDMIVYVPASAFVGVKPSDIVTVYNLNGVHYTADGDLAAEAGYEEWRAITSVPDGGATAILLGAGFMGLVALGRKRVQ